MNTIRQSTLAILIAIVSTAAFGPGSNFPRHPDAGSLHSRPAPLPQSAAFMHAALPGSATGMPAALLAGALPEDAGFLGIDFATAHEDGHEGAARADGAGFFTAGSAGGDHVGYGGAAAGGAAGAGTGGGSAAPARGRHPAPGSGVQLGGIGPLSGLDAAAAAAPGFDKAARVDLNIQQLPLLALAPPPRDFEIGGKAGDGPAETASAVPEPATTLLLALGLTGLLAARRSRRTAG